MEQLPEISGRGREVSAARERREPAFIAESDVDFPEIKSGFANALHMHQPLVPEGGDDLRTARVISHLQYMMEHQNIHDCHNAPVFRSCYKRMGEFIPLCLLRMPSALHLLDLQQLPLYHRSHDIHPFSHLHLRPEVAARIGPGKPCASTST